MREKERNSNSHKKMKNGPNDNMTDGRMRCMIVRVESGLGSDFFIQFFSESFVACVGWNRLSRSLEVVVDNSACS